MLICHEIPNVWDNIKLIMHCYLEDIDNSGWSIVKSEYLRLSTEQGLLKCFVTLRLIYERNLTGGFTKCDSNFKNLYAITNNEL